MKLIHQKTIHGFSYCILTYYKLISKHVGGKTNKPEWHIYSIAAFVMAIFVFIVNTYKGDQMTMAFVLLASFAQPIYVSDNWKLLSPQRHKSLIAISLIFIFGWVIRSIYINKILPKYEGNGNNH